MSEEPFPYTYIRVMADYCADGLWAQSGEEIDADEIELPETLKDRLSRWCRWFERLEQETTGNSDDVLESETRAFANEGRDIAYEVKRHVGPDVTVFYMDDYALKCIQDSGDCTDERASFEYEITDTMVNGSADMRSFFAEQRRLAEENLD